MGGGFFWVSLGISFLGNIEFRFQTIFRSRGEQSTEAGSRESRSVQLPAGGSVQQQKSWRNTPPPPPAAGRWAGSPPAAAEPPATYQDRSKSSF